MEIEQNLQLENELREKNLQLANELDGFEDVDADEDDF